MSDTPSTPSEKTVPANNASLCRLRTLVIISLGLNALILAGLVCFMVHHHRHGFSRFGDRGGRGACFCPMEQQRFDRHFQRFGGGPFMREQGWGRQGGFERGVGGAPPPDGGPQMGMMMGNEPKTPPSPAEMSDKILNGLSTRLALTDDQKAKVRPVIEQQVGELQKEMEARRQAMQKLLDDTKAKLKPMLNADQQKQLDAIKLPVPGQPKPPEPNEPHP